MTAAAVRVLLFSGLQQQLEIDPLQHAAIAPSVGNNAALW
jgi:hypothetical protein